ncbi:hypothetical protein [Pseudohalocynthiibacter sp. F2068]|uniref:hypothetical protein n=1 Tax=Pseudohalocynthiibacter sp. F2068 TaxID=2926418 RepID=UPI001FF511D6|nr:hypothetical protein [Pseudohalocynthiibacter sp. F2068]MCK0103234.1 hypothetical protein [Pseudohalocynthiibacter sp. F2068]
MRQLLVVGVTSLVRQQRFHPERASKWLAAQFERKPACVASVAMANKTAWIVLAVLTKTSLTRREQPEKIEEQKTARPTKYWCTNQSQNQNNPSNILGVTAHKTERNLVREPHLGQRSKTA